MKLGFNHSERVLVGAGAAFSLIALTALTCWCLVYVRLAITEHDLTIRLAGNGFARTELLLVAELTILVGVTCSFVAMARHRQRSH
jgi:hypothetical protein